MACGAALEGKWYLQVNARCREQEAGGLLHVQLIDSASDRVLDGYSRRESEQISGDSTRHRVHWSLKKTPPVRQQFRIEFRFQHCELFSFKAVSDEGSQEV